MALHRANVTRPQRKTEAVTVASLGGEVIVRGLTLSERLAIQSTEVSTDFVGFARLLALAVVDADLVPIFTVEEWDLFASEDTPAVAQLVAVARRLSGLDEAETAKN